jgi:hypothetical protein
VIIPSQDQPGLGSTKRTRVSARLDYSETSQIQFVKGIAAMQQNPPSRFIEAAHAAALESLSLDDATDIEDALSVPASARQRRPGRSA